MGKRNGVAEKGAAAETELGLMMMMQKKTHESFPRKKMMMMMPHHHHHHEPQPLLSSAGFSFGGEAACGVWDQSTSGPLLCNTSNPAADTAGVSDNIYNAAVGSDFVGSEVPKSLHQQQPYSDHTLSFTSSAGGMVNVNVKIPFTPAQREELERQAMIYKYMMASVPVPPQLLVPITKNPSSNVAQLYPNLVKGSLELGISSSSDPEPWRCKRTDGKKWRCSRDVAPDQKYCERHAHKTRSRSRKPVESNPNFINNNNSKNISMRSPRCNFFNQNNSNQQTPFSSNMVSASATSHAQQRSMAGFMNGETPSVAGGSNQEWEQMMQFKLGLKSCYSKCETDVEVSEQQNESSFNVYRERTGDSQCLQTHQRPSHDQYGLFPSPKLTHLDGALNSNQTQQTRHFIDAWSTAAERGDSRIGEIGNRGYASSNQKLPFSSLTLSMARGNETNEESETTQMGLGILGSERDNLGDLKSQWMNPLSWMSSPPGGPLAEALCLGISNSTRAASSSGCNSGSTSCRSSSGDVRQEFDLI